MALKNGILQVSRLLGQRWVRCCSPLACRYQHSSAEFGAASAEQSNLPGNREAEDENETAHPIENKKQAFRKPPSSHESPSLLYDPLASKFINMLMRDGKKSQAQRVFMESLEYIKRTQIAKVAAGGEEIVVNPIKIFHQAVENVKPAVATQARKRGGRSYHIPCSITEHRRTFLACKWIIDSARQKRGIGVAKKLAIDFIDSYNHRGTAIKKKQDLHRLADANRAFTHFRW